MLAKTEGLMPAIVYINTDLQLLLHDILSKGSLLEIFGLLLNLSSQFFEESHRLENIKNFWMLTQVHF